jgi:hypothetical protein
LIERVVARAVPRELHVPQAMESCALSR